MRIARPDLVTKRLAESTHGNMVVRDKLRVILVPCDLLGSSSELPRGLALRVFTAPDVYPAIKGAVGPFAFNPGPNTKTLRTLGKIVEKTQLK